jgi:hypothetical protein
VRERESEGRSEREKYSFCEKKKIKIEHYVIWMENEIDP